jgi:ribosomal protein L17
MCKQTVELPTFREKRHMEGNALPKRYPYIENNTCSKVGGYRRILRLGSRAGRGMVGTFLSLVYQR